MSSKNIETKEDGIVGSRVDECEPDRAGGYSTRGNPILWTIP
jgi:hypothetical protein